VEESVNTYKLDLVRYAMPMKEAFKRYLNEHAKIKAILVGTRRTDPHGQSLTHFDPTDSGWPAFMRVHPVIDWHYAEIWAVCPSILLDFGLLLTFFFSLFGIVRFHTAHFTIKATHLLEARLTPIQILH
jgi:hypothetical protein